jgi:hypothetical protein
MRRIALVFVGRSDLSQDFTSDLGRLLRTVRRVKEALGFGLDPIQQLSGLQQQLRAGASRARAMAGPAQCGVSFARSVGWELKNAAAALATSGHPRRAIVLVSGGVSINPKNVIDVPARPLTLRIGVSSRVLGRAGTVRVALDVPSLSSGKIQLGGITGGRDGSTATPISPAARSSPRGGRVSAARRRRAARLCRPENH